MSKQRFHDTGGWQLEYDNVSYQTRSPGLHVVKSTFPMKRLGNKGNIDMETFLKLEDSQVRRNPR